MTRKFGSGRKSSASPKRSLRRRMMRGIKNEQKRRARNVARLDGWMRENPDDPLTIRLRAAKAGLSLVEAEDMLETPGKIETLKGEGSAVILPQGVEYDGSKKS